MVATSSLKLKGGESIKSDSLPKDEHFRNILINACKRKENINVKNAKIWSEHFSQDNFFKIFWTIKASKLSVSASET